MRPMVAVELVDMVRTSFVFVFVLVKTVTTLRRPFQRQFHSRLECKARRPLDDGHDQGGQADDATPEPG